MNVKKWAAVSIPQMGRSMILVPLTRKDEIKIAYTKLKSQMNKRAQMVDTVLGWKGQSQAFTVAWHADLGIWNYYDAKFAKTRYWCPCGVEDPNEISMVNIIVEINTEYQGYDRRVAGAFVHDGNNNIYLTHSGKVAGGRKGVGKEGFWNSYRGNQIVTITWPDRIETEAICIGKLGNKNLPRQIAHFVKEVARFKKHIVSGKIKVRKEPALLDNPTFDPEFSGKRKGYRRKGPIESKCDHGRIVSALNDELESRGLKTANDRPRDLYVYNSKKNMDILFEVKTDLSSSSIYSSIGQLMYHGASQEPAPTRVLVIPGVPDKKTRRILNRLEIEVMEYSWEEDKPKFLNINQIIRSK